MRNNSSNDRLWNLTVNAASQLSLDIGWKYHFDRRVNLQDFCHDHDYFSRPILELWIEDGIKISQEDIKNIEKETRQQSKSHKWLTERKCQITASNFGTVIKATGRKNIEALLNLIFLILKNGVAEAFKEQQLQEKAVELNEALRYVLQCATTRGR